MYSRRGPIFKLCCISRDDVFHFYLYCEHAAGWKLDLHTNNGGREKKNMRDKEIKRNEY